MPPRRSSEESPRRRGDADEASHLPEEEQAGGGLFSQAMQMANDAIKQVEAGEDEPQKESPVADDANDSNGGFMGRFSAPTELPADLDATISTVGVVTDGNHPHRAQKSLSERNHSDHVQALLESVAGSAPPRLAKVVHALGPIVAKLTALLDTAGPPALVFWQKLMFAMDKLPQSVSPHYSRTNVVSGTTHQVAHPVACTRRAMHGVHRLYARCTVWRSAFLAEFLRTQLRPWKLSSNQVMRERGPASTT